MQIILLFDEESLNGKIRTYTLAENEQRCLSDGMDIEITFCHPHFGEKFIVNPVAEPTAGPDEGED